MRGEEGGSIADREAESLLSEVNRHDEHDKANAGKKAYDE